VTERNDVAKTCEWNARWGRAEEHRPRCRQRRRAPPSATHLSHALSLTVGNATQRAQTQFL